MAEIDESPGKTLERSTEEIRQDIFEKLDSLSKTIDQIGSRMHEIFDWREHITRHPYIILGAAAGMGLLLSGLLKPSPSPRERIMDAIGETVEDIGNSVQASLKERTISKTVAPNLITIVGTTMLKAGVDLLLAKVGKDKPVDEMATNGKETPASKITQQQTQAKRAF